MSTDRDAPPGGGGTAPLLAVRGASKRFDGEVALEDASLEVRPGEVHALMGENGAGKSTLIKLLAGIEVPDAMQLEVRGRSERVRGPGDAGRLGLRFIHQELNVVPALSVAENIFLGHDYPRRPTGLVDWRALRARARDTLAGLGVHHVDPAVPMNRLGTGDAMLVSIARAFVEPAGAGEAGLVYVMDEPTAALSRHETALLFEVVRGLRSRGAGVLYVSHRMEEIFEIADRITVLRDGRVVRTVATQHATREGLIHAMTGRALDGSYGGASEGGPQGDARAGAPALAARDVRTAGVHGVSLEVWPGEVVGVTGLAGSGRTELLRALLGADPLREGQLLLAGQEVRLGHPAAAWAAGLAYVPEERRSQALAMGADVRRNMLLPHLVRVSTFGVADRGRERRETEAWAREVRLRARGPNQVVHELSGGNQQKVVLARALAARPRVLLLDEPTRGVDVGAKADIYRLVRQAAADGAAVLLASSDLDEVLGVCERVLVLHEGRITHERPVATLDRGALLELCYGGAAA